MIKGTTSNELSHFAVLMDSDFKVKTWAVMLIMQSMGNKTNSVVIRDGNVVLNSYHNQDGNIQEGYVVQEGVRKNIQNVSPQGYDGWSGFKECLADRGFSTQLINILIKLCVPLCMITLGVACLDCAAVYIAGKLAPFTYCLGATLLS